MGPALLLAVLGAADDSMAVLPLQARRVEPEIVAILDDLLATELSAKHDAQVISSSDIAAMLSVEQQKDALGCDDVTCAAEIGGALGARTLVTGSVSRLGEKLIVQLSLIDSSAVLVRSRAKSSVPNEERYFESAIRSAVSELLGDTPTPSTWTAEGAPGSKIIFNTIDDELEFNASIVAASGQQFGCSEAIKLGAGCTVGSLPSGKARVMVSAPDHNPAIETAAVEGMDSTVVYRVDSELSTWSWICYLGGGAMAFTGGMSLGLSNLGEETSGVFTGIGVTYLVLGTGLLGLGYFLDRDVSLERVELSPESKSTLTVVPTVGTDGAGLGAVLRW